VNEEILLDFIATADLIVKLTDDGIFTIGFDDETGRKKKLICTIIDENEEDK